MDWIERLFRISPDGGSGSIEALIFAALVMVAAGVTWRAWMRTRL
jgi:hypothetical protein